MRWFWLSFADPHRPEGEQFLGVSIVGVNELSLKAIATFGLEPADRDPFVFAVKVAKVLGINPGGEVQGFEIPAELIAKVPDEMRNRLLTRDEAESLDY